MAFFLGLLLLALALALVNLVAWWLGIDIAGVGGIAGTLDVPGDVEPAHGASADGASDTPEPSGVNEGYLTRSR